MELASFQFEVKAVSDAGEFTGFASTYDQLDHGGDIVERGAFTADLKAHGSERPVLWSHDPANPVGLGVLKDSRDGLLIDGTLDLDIQVGRDAFSRLKKRIVKGLSIGYLVSPGGASFDNGVRRLKAIEVLEVSLTAIPMNPSATITSIKAVDSIRNFEAFLHQQGWSKRESKRLASHGWAGLSLPDDQDSDEELLDFLRSCNAGR